MFIEGYHLKVSQVRVAFGHQFVSLRVDFAASLLTLAHSLTAYHQYFEQGDHFCFLSSFYFLCLRTMRGHNNLNPYKYENNYIIL